MDKQSLRELAMKLFDFGVYFHSQKQNLIQYLEPAQAFLPKLSKCNSLEFSLY